jgi:hypothetical protein
MEAAQDLQISALGSRGEAKDVKKAIKDLGGG